jgi:hypothetical protein
MHHEYVPLKRRRLLAAISLLKLIVSDESLGFLSGTLHVCFKYTRKSSRCQREMRFRLDKEERLLPRPNHSSQNSQKQPVPLPIDRSFDLPTQDDQLLPQQGVFRQQFGFASGHIGERSEHKEGRCLIEVKRESTNVTSAS